MLPTSVKTYEFNLRNRRAGGSSDIANASMGTAVVLRKGWEL